MRPGFLILLGLIFDLVGALLLAPAIVSRAKRTYDVYKLLRTDGLELSAFQVTAYLRKFKAEPERLGTPEEELVKYWREWLPVAIAVFLLSLGYTLQIIGTYMQIS